MNLSIVIPLLNEQESLQELYARIKETLQSQLAGIRYEVIFVDDGSTDASWEVIEKISKENKQAKGIKFKKNYGKAQALNAAFFEAQGDIVITMDADLQDFPEEIPNLYHRIINEELDLISGWKQKRKDPVLTKNLPSKLFNAVARKTSGLHLHDFNCGLKAYRKELVKTLKLRSDMHRYIPVLAKNAGFTKIAEQRVRHTARKHGVSKFGTSRFVNGFLDLITLWFIEKFGSRPMHFFGAAGTLMFIIGFLTALGIGGKKLYLLSQGIPARLVTEDAWFYISLTSMVMGSQLFLAGFLGELIIRMHEDKVEYQVDKQLNI